MNISGLRHLLQSALRETHYTSETYQRYFESGTHMKHPFGDNSPGFVEWVGSPGHTASIGAFIWGISRLISGRDEVDRLIFHMFAAGEEQHLVVAEFRTNFETYLCGGMTNFSGEGRWGYGTVRDVFEFLSQMFHIEVEYVWHPFGAWETVEYEIEQEIYMQSLEMEE